MNCKDCKFHMTAYLHGELRPKVRQRMTQHIEQCPMCYTVYIQQRDIQRELAYSVPLVGTIGRYDKMWASIQADMSYPREPRFQIRFGLVALMLAMALLLPLTLGRQQRALAAVPTQPSPELAVTRTPSMGGARTMETMAPLFYSIVMTPEAQFARVPDGTP